MKKRFFLILSCMLLAQAIAGCSGSAGKKASPDTASESDKQTAADSDTQAAPDGNTQTATDSEAPSDNASVTFEAPTIDGETLSSDIFKDSRLTMINVWATYCNPCLNEMPELGELASEYDSADFQLLGIISDVADGAPSDMVELADSLIEETNADYPHMLLNESLYYAFLSDVTAVPTTFFFNEDGEIVDTVIGAMGKADWEEKIDELLEEL